MCYLVFYLMWSPVISFHHRSPCLHLDCHPSTLMLFPLLGNTYILWKIYLAEHRDSVAVSADLPNRVSHLRRSSVVHLQVLIQNTVLPCLELRTSASFLSDSEFVSSSTQYHQAKSPMVRRLGQMCCQCGSSLWWNSKSNQDFCLFCFENAAMFTTCLWLVHEDKMIYN